jgi:hypothetical protein
MTEWHSAASLNALTNRCPSLAAKFRWQQTKTPHPSQLTQECQAKDALGDQPLSGLCNATRVWPPFHHGLSSLSSPSVLELTLLLRLSEMSA